MVRRSTPRLTVLSLLVVIALTATLLAVTAYAISTVTRVEEGPLTRIYKSTSEIEVSLSPSLIKALKLWDQRKSLILSVALNDQRVQDKLLSAGRWKYLGVLFSGRVVNGKYFFEAYTLVFKLNDELLERKGFEKYLYIKVDKDMKIVKVEERIMPKIPNEPASQVDKGLWAGYVFYEAGYPSYYGVSGVVDVVPVSIPSTGGSAFQVWGWVGLTTDTQGSVIMQSGWTAWYDASTNGQFYYAAWVWLYNTTGSGLRIDLPDPVGPGDRLSIDILYDPTAHQYLVFVNNPTKGWSEVVRVDAHLAAPYACLIVEAGRNGYLLPQFTSICFHDMAVYTGYVDGTWQGHTVEKNYWAGNYIRYLMWYSGATYNAISYFNDSNPSTYWDAWISIVYQHS